ncbi:ribosome biogenesis GTPase Der [candidate division TA06 bacterium B3_TA06]|uniref:GTPase Der n=1 Tax=candidate division TA06 bacterium B3_TA06 TaxID=2012487 RepID=A0A532V191_UNCT6|nr:MAG: ribosome biogenesis GTPase Der [candidate division TA06 bacterium B3_TA06]
MNAVVALVGRPNVGKSTLFNRLVGHREAITLKTPGITRDRLYGTVHWLSKSFTLIDTGGFIPQPEQPLEEQMRHQVQLAIKEAELVLLAVDGKEGLHPADKALAETLRKEEKPYIVVVNKSDVRTAEWEHHSFHVLGGAELFLVSAEHGVGFGDLLEEICARLTFGEEGEPRPEVKLLIAGRPNCGKSTLLNAIVGEERAVVDEVPGTTRDPVDTYLEVSGRIWRLVDTAGLRRRTRIKENVEYYASTRLRRALAKAQIILLLIDLTEGVTRQDKRLAAEIIGRRKGLIFVLNKIDLFDSQALRNKLDEASYQLRGIQQFFRVLVSGKEKKGLDELIGTVTALVEKRSQRIPKELLGEFVQKITRERPPGRRTKIYRFIQKEGAPPLFLAETNKPDELEETYLRFLTNRLRDAFDFTGTNLKLQPTQRPRRR